MLLSTTIVESGLDIPSANTIIIHRADRFGLAQLYQLRGRVGRAKLRAYAYLTTPKDTVLNEVAEKRLKVLGDLDSLGAGFQLASHDLDIRGAGNLLGDEQSGHIREVGFELYQSMLEDAILAAKAGEIGLEREREGLSPQITVDAPIMIPEDYVPDLAVRMALYRRLNDAKDKAEIESAGRRDDRPLRPAARGDRQPGQADRDQAPGDRGLHRQDRRRRARHAGQLPPGPASPIPAGLIAYVERLQGTAKLRPDMKLVINRAWGDPQSAAQRAAPADQGAERDRAQGRKARDGGGLTDVVARTQQGPRMRGPLRMLAMTKAYGLVGLVVVGQLDDAPDEQARADRGDDPHGRAANLLGFSDSGASARSRPAERPGPRSARGQRQRGTRGNCTSKHDRIPLILQLRRASLLNVAARNVNRA